MGIVLVYRSSRVINFAVGDLGVPAAALLAVMVGQAGLAVLARRSSARLLVGTLTGTVVELAVIRRLFQGAARDRARRDDRRRASCAQAVTLVAPRLPHRRAADAVTRARSAVEWHRPFTRHHRDREPSSSCSSSCRSSRSGCGGCSATPASARRCGRRRPTPTSPASPASARRSCRPRSGRSPGSSSTVVGDPLRDRDQGSTELVSIGPETLLLGLAAALIGGMISFPQRRRSARSRVGILDQVLVLQLPERDRARAVRALHHRARARRADEPRRRRRAARASRSRRASRRFPSGCARSGGCGACRSWSPGFALLVAVVLPLLVARSRRGTRRTRSSSRSRSARCRSTVLTGWGGQLSLGQMAFAGIGALSARRVRPRRHAEHRLAVAPAVNGASSRFRSSCSAIASRDRRDRVAHAGEARLAVAIAVVVAVAASLFIGRIDRVDAGRCRSRRHPPRRARRVPLAVLVGTGALRVKGLLLAISTMAFAIAAESYIFGRPIFTGSRRAHRQLPRASSARRPRAPQPQLLLLRAGRASSSCCCSSATSAAPASAA